MPHVGEPRSGTVVDVRLRTHDLGNHRQAADGSGAEVADADGDHVAIHIRLAFPRIEQVNRFGAQQRLQAADDEEHHDPLPRFWLGQCREFGRGNVVEHAEHAIGHLDEILFAELILVSLQRVRVLVQQVEGHSHRHRDQQHDHRRRNGFQRTERRLPTSGQRNMIAMLTMPIAAIAGLASAM